MKKKMSPMTPSPSDTDLHFILDGFRDTLHINLYSLWKSSQLCDLTLQMLDGAVCVHSCLMAAFSPTIAEMLTTVDGYFNEKGKTSQRCVTIEVGHLSFEMMKSVVSSIYTCRLDASSKNIKDLLDTVRWLGIQHLVTAIEQACGDQLQDTSENKPNEREEASFSNSFKVVIGNENVEGAFHEQMENKDSLTLSPQTVPTLCKVSSSLSTGSFLIEKEPPYSTHSKNLDLQRTESTDFNKITKVSSQNWKSKDTEYSVSGRSIKAEFIHPSSFLEPSDQVSFLHGTDSLMTCDSENENVNIALDNIEKDLLNGLIGEEMENSNAKMLSELPTSSLDHSAPNQKCLAIGKAGKKRKNSSMKFSATERRVLKAPKTETLSPKESESANKTDDVAVHLRRARGNLRPYKCQNCNLRFRCMDKYNEHINKHPIFYCNECPKTFCLKSNLTRHQFNVHRQKNHLICEECSFQASSSKELRSHSMKEHNQPKPFSCKYPGCNYRNQAYSIIVNHMDVCHADMKDQTKENNMDIVAKPMTVKTKDGLKPYKCHKCPLRFDDVDKYNDHTNNHPVYSCPECTFTFFSKKLMTGHRFADHLENKHKICDECSFRASTASGLVRHSIQEHNQPKPFHCKHPGCNYRSELYYNVENHFDACHNEGRKPIVKNHVCNHCGRKFATASYLDDHTKSCLRLEGFLCDICGEAFNRKQYLKAHKLVVHCKIRSHKCSQCSKTFGRRTSLTKHLLVHKNIFPHSCVYCSKHFRYRPSLKAHIRLVHRDLPQIPPKVMKNYKYKDHRNNFRLKRQTR